MLFRFCKHWLLSCPTFQAVCWYCRYCVCSYSEHLLSDVELYHRRFGNLLVCLRFARKSFELFTLVKYACTCGILAGLCNSTVRSGCVSSKMRQACLQWNRFTSRRCSCGYLNTFGRASTIYRVRIVVVVGSMTTGILLSHVDSSWRSMSGT